MALIAKPIAKADDPVRSSNAERRNTSPPPRLIGSRASALAWQKGRGAGERSPVGLPGPPTATKSLFPQKVTRPSSSNSGGRCLAAPLNWRERF
jgi:hypothetical protein